MSVAPLLRCGGACLALVLALSTQGCTRSEPPPNVVLVLIDQLRKDYADQYLEAVNAVAERGVVLDEMRAAAPWTYPSVISLMSGLYPQQHGADGHPRDQTLSRIDSELPLLQKHLKAAGYATAAFVANPFLLPWNDFHTGFDHFDGSFVGSEDNRVGDARVWRPRTMFANAVNRAVRAWFDARPLAGPEFTYIHYIDVHGPWRDAPFRPGYVQAIRYVDRKVMELYDYFLARYDGRVLFVVTSDHGRALDDDERVGFGREWRREKRTVHDFNLRIPFAILPSTLPDTLLAVRVPGPASNVDVVPTLLDWLGVETATPLPGMSLLPAIRGIAPLSDERPLYARNAAFGHRNDAIVHRGYKRIRFFDLDDGHVVARHTFDLAADPRETQSLTDDFGDAAALLDESAGDHGLAFDVEFDTVVPGVEQRLKELGYLGEEP